MPWLMRDGEVLCSVEVASTRRERRRGLLGRDHLEGALWLTRARSVHTLGMKFPIDVAHLDRDGAVVHTCTMVRNRIGRPVLSSRSVLEAPAGVFDTWRLEVGDVVEIRDGNGR